MRQVDGHGHQRGRFVAGKAKHHALVAGADRFDLGFAHLAASFASSALSTPMAISPDWLAMATSTPQVLPSKPLSLLS